MEHDVDGLVDPFDGKATWSLLTRGQLAEVYAAHAHDGVARAIKCARMSSRESAQSIRHEARVLSEHRHPGVVAIGDYDLAAERPWFAMPLHAAARFGAGASAQAFAAERAHGAKLIEACRPELALIRHVADTLCFLHGREVVHRDLKPSNIMLDAEGYPVLVDFGISLAQSGAPDAGSEWASVSFAAPEHLRGECIDARVDLYALGALLCLTLTGRAPRSMLTADDLEQLEIYLENMQVPVPLRALTTGLLQPEVQRRIAHADTVAHVLDAELGVAARPGLPPARPYLCQAALLGRAHEIKRLDEERACARAGRGNLLLLSGVSGVGKSRLLESLRQAAHRERFQIISARCGELGRQDVEPLEGLRPFLRHVASTTRADDPTMAPLLRARAAVLLPFEASLQRWLPDGASPLPVAGLSAQPNVVSSAQVQASVLALLHAFCQDRATVLLVDDAQWADDLTLDVLHDFATKAWVAPACLIVAAARSEEMPAALASLRGQGRLRELRVEDLSVPLTSMLARELLGGSHILEPLVASLYAHSTGNPLLVVACIEHCLTVGCLRREAGAWLLDPSLWPSGASGTPTEPIVRRVNAVKSSARALLAAAAVLGRRFDLRVATELASLDHSALSAGLSELCSLRILEQDGPWLFRFVHDKLLEAAYVATDADASKQLHARAAELVRGQASAAELARHAGGCGDHEQGFVYCMQAAKEAIDQGRVRQGAGYLDRAEGHRAAIGREPSAVVRSQIATGRAAIAFQRFDYALCARFREHGLEALGVTVPRNNIGWLRSLLGGLIEHLWLRMCAPFARPRMQADTERFSLLARHYYGLGGCMLYDNGSPLGAVACQLRSATAAERSREWGWAARCSAGLGLITSCAGLTRWALRCFDRANDWAASAADAGDSRSALFCDTLEGLHHYYRGEPQRARVVVERRTERALQCGPTVELLQNLGICALCALGEGDLLNARRFTRILQEQVQHLDTRDAYSEGKVLELAILIQEEAWERAAAGGLAAATELEARGSLLYQCAALAIAAVAMVQLGRRDETARAIETISRVMLRRGTTNFVAHWVYSFLPEAVLQLAERAPDLTQRAHWLSTAKPIVQACLTFRRLVPRMAPKALYFRARVLAIEGRLTRALRAVTRARVLAGRMQQPFESAHCLALSAQLRRAAGKPYETLEAEARESLEVLHSRWQSSS